MTVAHLAPGASQRGPRARLSFPLPSRNQVDEKDIIGYFAILPPEVAILCVDGSFRTAVKLGSTNKMLKVKLLAAGTPLRIISPNLKTIMHAKRGNTFEIGEVEWSRPLRVNHVRTLVSGWTHLLPRLHTITISPSPQSIGHTSVSATVYLRMFWSEYLTRYGVEAVFAVMERVTIRQRPLLCV